MTLPRVRVLLVDGRAYPEPPADLLSGTRVEIPGAHRPRLVQTDRCELLVENAPFAASAPMRTRGLDAVVVIAGGSLRRHADALASARVSGAPLLVTVSSASEEAALRSVLAGAGFAADDAVACTATSTRPDAAQAAVLQALERIVPRAPGRMHLADVMPGGNRVLVDGTAPGHYEARALGVLGFGAAGRVDVESNARAGDVVVVRGISPEAPCAMSDPPWPCAFGALELEWPSPPPPSPHVVAFSAAAEVRAVVDTRGRVVLAHALPIPPSFRVGVFVVSAPLRPSTQGDLGASVLVGTLARHTPLFGVDERAGRDIIVDGAVAGRVRVRFESAYSDTLEDLHVLPERRGQGIGRRVVRALVDGGVARGATLHVVLEPSRRAPADLARLERFFTSCGLRARDVAGDRVRLSSVT